MGQTARDSGTRDPGAAARQSGRLAATGALVVLLSVLLAGLAGFRGDVVTALGATAVAAAGVLLVGIGSRPESLTE